MGEVFKVATKFTSENPEVFCGLKHFTHPYPFNTIRDIEYNVEQVV